MGFILSVENEQHCCRFLENAITEMGHMVASTDSLAGPPIG